MTIAAIANPIYDTVFKYLLEDNQVAKLLISAVIGRKITELKVKPQENTIHIESTLGAQITVYRLDFIARVETEFGTKLVLIELQKTKYPMDIIRFRRYLGDQYKRNDDGDSVIDSVLGQKVPPEIITIYFLGYTLEKIDAAIVQVNRQIVNGATKESINISDKFIESLTHESVIIQIPYLRKNRRSEVEKILSVFDQAQRSEDHHILNVKEEDFPENYRPIIRRLQQASAQHEVREQMIAEDEVLEDIRCYERMVVEKTEENLRQKAELAEKDLKLQSEQQAKNVALQEKESALQALQEKDNALKKLQELLAKSGIKF